MLRSIVRIIVVLTCVWVLADSIFGFENSWILFLARVFSPILFLVSVGGLCIGWLWCARNTEITPFITWPYALLITIACAAPTLRSLIFLPHTLPPPPTSTSDTAPLRLLNFNILGFDDLSPALLLEIAQRNPDIVTLQEVNPAVAETLNTHLASTYPCQVMDPAAGSWGMGIISKHPCTPIPISHSGNWVGKPQVVAVEIAPQKKVVIANVHAIHPHASLQPDPRNGPTPLTTLSQTVRAREHAIEQVLEVLRATGGGASIIAGDLNATMRNSVYEKIRSAGYTDTWLTKHSLMSGGTWPVLRLANTRLASEVIRIDFVFHSQALQPLLIEQLSPDTGSDHRGLFAIFQP
jgi:endonuclease/exonuclease/phosphatase (EEP) superfamily protein YafD